MEKKYLEVIKEGQILGAFEDVKNVQEKTVGSYDFLDFDSDEGHLQFARLKNHTNWVRQGFIFDSYKVIGRRTLLRHADKAGVYVQSKRKA